MLKNVREKNKLLHLPSSSLLSSLQSKQSSVNRKIKSSDPKAIAYKWLQGCRAYVTASTTVVAEKNKQNTTENNLRKTEQPLLNTISIS